MQFQRVFVTVGTTKFDSLILEVCKKETAAVLKKLGCKEITIQYGNGAEVDGSSFEELGIRCENYRYKPNINADIESSDLVISHAGAGTCMEILTTQKPAVVVVNEDLMDNHQSELAEQLHKDGFVFCCVVKTLAETLRQSRFATLKVYTRGDGLDRFVQRLNVLMGV